MSQNIKILVALIAVAIIASGGYFLFLSQNNKQETPTPPNNETALTKVIILVPENKQEYKSAMTKFAQTGGEDPLTTTKFIKKEITVSADSDLIKTSAQLAAQEIPYGDEATKASVEYLEVKDKIAYVLLDIDVESWAGVSVSRAIIHPLVEKTLLEFREIDKVEFKQASN